MEIDQLKFKSLLGGLTIFASAFCFYLSTAAIRWSKLHVQIDPAYFVFVRFVLGFLVICAILAIRRQRIKPRRYDLLVSRTLTNCVAVYCFYAAVDATTVAEANILNMTYPVFIAIFSWLFLRDQRDVVATLTVLVAFAGIWLILAPARMTMGLHNLWGVASGFSAAFSIVYLNLSRMYHDSETILFFMFGPGILIMFLLFHEQIFLPNRTELYYLFLCGSLGVGGQYLLTVGFRYVTAVEGAVVSSTRILLAALLGPYIALDPPLSLYGWIGAVLIFAANIILAVRKARIKT